MSVAPKRMRRPGEPEDKRACVGVCTALELFSPGCAFNSVHVLKATRARNSVYLSVISALDHGRLSASSGLAFHARM